MPRPEPSAEDETAHAFLRAGAQMIDAMLTVDADTRPARVRSFPYPPPVDWIRVEDVVRLAELEGGEKPSRKAFRNRWASKDDFARDLVVFALLWKDLPAGPDDGAQELRRLLRDDSIPMSERITRATDQPIEFLRRTPRSLLMAHLVPVLASTPDLLDEIVAADLEQQRAWVRAYEEARAAFHAQWRPGWDSAKFVLCIQALLDGLLVRSRLQPNGLSEDEVWDIAESYSSAALALLIGAIDVDGQGLSVPEVVDHAAALLAGRETTGGPSAGGVPSGDARA